MFRSLMTAALLGSLMMAWPAAHAQNEAKEKAKDNSPSDFFDGWGIGLAVIQPRSPSITEATIVNDIVRVNSQSRQEASLLVSRHFYVMSDGEPCSRHLNPKTAAEKTAAESRPISQSLWLSLRRCVGLMVGVGLGSSGSSPQSSLINFAGLGLTFGSGVKTGESVAWHFGFGLGRKFNARLLGDGVEEGKAPPTGETQIRFKTVDLEAKFIYFSTHW